VTLKAEAKLELLFNTIYLYGYSTARCYTFIEIEVYTTTISMAAFKSDPG